MTGRAERGLTEPETVLEPHTQAAESASFKTLISPRKYNNPSQDMWPRFLLFLIFVLLFISLNPWMA